MNQHKNSGNLSNIGNYENSEQKDLLTEIINEVNNFNNKENCVPMDIPFQECIKLFDKTNLDIIKQNLIEKEIQDDLLNNMKKTPNELRGFYTDELIYLIKAMNKSNEFKELPRLPFGNQLSDKEFIDLLGECISYANYKLESQSIYNIKNRLLNDYYASLKNLFQRGQIIKDIIENALITILTTDVKTEQEDNFNLLNIENSTATPIISMNFNNKEECKLDRKELQDIFCSYVYIKKYKKALKEFTDNVPSEDKLKSCIRKYFEKHYIYFCDLPPNILAFTIYSGNIYLKGNYLYEYYNAKNDEDRLLIREKIILNIGHKIMHILMREINSNMKDNFLLKINQKKIKRIYLLNSTINSQMKFINST